jgi:hypothetical protein
MADDGFAERMAGEPQIRDATLDELLEVFGEDQVDQMAAHGTLTPAQRRAWVATNPTPPPFSTPVPEA